MVVALLTNPADRDQRESAVRHAAECLRRGDLVVLPTETVYGVFADASSRGALEKLARLTIRPGERSHRAGYTWHAASVNAVLDALPVLPATHRILMGRLLPGPVRFDISPDPDQLAQTVAALGVAPGVLDDGGTLAVRVPGQPTTLRVLERVGAPVVANRLSTAGWSPDRAIDDDGFQTWADGAGIAMAIDEGPARFGSPSSLVRLLPDGGYLVDEEGAYDRRMIDKHAHLQILFVCTGNTCRSPMAEAIARSLLSDLPTESAGSPITVAVASAGTSAGSGAGASPQTGSALREIGVEPLPHRSRPLTRAAVAEADAIFTMSGFHREEVIALDPTAGARTSLLDPSGQDVPDPVGLPQEVYNRTAAKLCELVRQRLTEMGAIGPEPAGSHAEKEQG